MNMAQLICMCHIAGSFAIGHKIDWGRTEQDVLSLTLQILSKTHLLL